MKKRGRPRKERTESEVPRYVKLRGAMNDILAGPALSQEKQAQLEKAEVAAIEQLEMAYDAVVDLVVVRHDCKLSTFRAGNIVGELGELIKVMTTCDRRYPLDGL